ncbi:MAG: hypothetical protein VYA17_09330 [Pseudomonadota bacterium]|nr:hypothetical protein [Pseudomonadota bacterium]
MITLAIDRYDSLMPFFDGTVSFTDHPEIHVMQFGRMGALRRGSDRHERMLQDLEFDAAETSLASYIVAR